MFNFPKMTSVQKFLRLNFYPWHFLARKCPKFVRSNALHILGALILSRIIDRVPNPTIEKVASIYNYTGKEKVSDYGLHVIRIYEDRLWEN